jgi:hypothetical protein
MRILLAEDDERMTSGAEACDRRRSAHLADGDR